MSTPAPDFNLELEEAIAASAPNKDTAGESEVPDVPEKLKGKSVSELIDMYTNAEKKISEQGNQLHELRSLSDQLIGLKKDNAPKEKVKVTTEDLLTDPNLALNKVIGSSDVADKVAKNEDRLDALEKSIGHREFETKHPSYMEDVQDPEFRAWVAGNSARTGLLMDLNSNYNFQAGTALWDMWNEHKELTSQPKLSKKEVIRAASTVRNSPSEGTRKPVYSRAKLMELQAAALRGDRVAKAKWSDPEFQAEYQAAYAEKRVK